MRSPSRSSFSVAVALSCCWLASSASTANAADLFGGDAASLLRTDTFSVEANVSYLAITAGEYVYHVPGSGAKVSQLNWKVDNGAAVGGRVAFRPFDWLTLRAKGWTAIAADSAMQDYDWLGGYYGFDSWTHRSLHPKTELTKAWQGDVSVAATFWGEEGLSLSGIAGYRHLTTKWKSKGGFFLYSANDFRDRSGTFPDSTVIAYQQWWDTPYLGLGLTLSTEDLVVNGEVIGSPLVQARAKDHHVLRDLIAPQHFDISGMVGASLGADYRLMSNLWFTSRVEYQKYFEARGRSVFDEGGVQTYLPTPGMGADAETFLASVGVKARL